MTYIIRATHARSAHENAREDVTASLFLLHTPQPSFGLSLDFPQYTRQTRPGTCAAYIVTPIAIDDRKEILSREESR